MKKQKHITRQYPVNGANTMKPELSTWRFVDNLGVLQPYDATKDVTEQTEAEVQYRRLLEDHTLRAVTEMRDSNQEAKAARMFFTIAMTVLLTALFFIIQVRQ